MSDFYINNDMIFHFVRYYINIKQKLPKELQDLPIGKWNVSKVTNMSRLFHNCIFNESIDEWDVSNVTDMSQMFSGAHYFNKPLAAWNVSNVTNMEEMFRGAYAFNQPLNDWKDKTGNVKNMFAMFCDAESFNQPIEDWDVSNVTNMGKMFYYTKNSISL